MAQFTGIRACVFDAYGTLFDIHAPAQELKSRLGPDFEAFSGTWRRKQLEYAWLRSLMDAFAPFNAVTAQALDFALDAHGISDRVLRAELLASYEALDAYPDAARALDALNDRGIPAAILSNGTPAMLRAAANAAGLSFLDDAILSAGSVEIYKPAPAVYALATERFGCEADDILFVSANGWDVAGGAAFGFRTVHVNRSDAPEERLPFAPTATVRDLDALTRLLG